MKKYEEKVVLPNGIAINLVAWPGAETMQERTLFFIHGLADSSCIWQDVVARLIGRFRIFSVDLRGHGDSDWALNGNYDIDTMASDIVSLLRVKDLGQMTIVGHSLGAAVGLRLASMRTVSTTSLIIMDFGPETDSQNKANLRRALRDAHRAYQSVDEYTKILSERHPLASRNLLEKIANEAMHHTITPTLQLKYDPVVLDMATTQPQTDINNWKLLSTLNCPTLLLRGAASSVLSKKTAEKMLREYLRFGALATIPMAGHSIQIDNPNAVAEAIDIFCSNF
jgi:pimeloyl-ACP methyl ester carboxylesterase